MMMTTPEKRKRRPSLTFTDTQLLGTACLMPGGMQHWPDRGQPFDIAKSEVVGWLISQPEIQYWLFERLKESQAIVFDAATRAWSGNPAATAIVGANVPPVEKTASLPHLGRFSNNKMKNETPSLTTEAKHEETETRTDFVKSRDREA
jgi:hypothetical protein